MRLFAGFDIVVSSFNVVADVRYFNDNLTSVIFFNSFPHSVDMGHETPAAERRSLPSRNPLPLSAAQEGQVRDLYYKRVRAHCADEIRGNLSPRTRLLQVVVIYEH